MSIDTILESFDETAMQNLNSRVKSIWPFSVVYSTKSDAYDIQKWCEENCEGPYSVVLGVSSDLHRIFFTNERDALMATLKWGSSYD